MNNNQIVQEWLRYAGQDLDSARYLMGMKPLPVEIICYHCQQSVEKYLKAFLCFHGETIRRTHDLIALNKLCIQYDNAFLEIEEECLSLTDYGVQARYPFHLDLNETDAQSAIITAERVQVFLMEKLPSVAPPNSHNDRKEPYS